MTDTYAGRLRDLRRRWPRGAGQVSLHKATASNLFRYRPRVTTGRRLSLADFNHVIDIDTERRQLELEGLATYETIVGHCLPHGLLPGVTPELKHITVGGATVGIGIESTCFRHGFVHDGLLEADVLLPGGEVLTCTATNEHADLFHALPNSYGTLGYVLRARIELHPALPFVQMEIRRYQNSGAFLQAMREATGQPEVDFIEGLFFGDGRHFLMLGRFREAAPATDDILRRHIFYRLVQEREAITLSTRDYIFRYDPEWFWNIPDTLPFRLFRRWAPRRFRNSGFYSRHAARKQQRGPAGRPAREPLIQDWQVPWAAAPELCDFALAQVDLGTRPWAAVPIRTPRQPTLYPISPGELWFNLGSYCQVEPAPGRAPFHYTRMLDRRCFDLGGIKMLYSSTFLDEEEFDARYNGAAYRRLKARYDPDGEAPTLFQKVSLAQD